MKLGIISEQTLINYCATEKQKVLYNKNKYFVSNLKKSVLKNASLEYNIIDLGDKKYEITKIYEFKLPICINKLHTGLYQYIVPLMLTKIILEKDKYNKVNFTFYKWARLIDMINHNYYPIKKNTTKFSKELNISETTMEEYFTRVDDSLHYYIHNSLENLKNSGLINWYKVLMVCIKHVNIDNNFSIDKQNIDFTFNCEIRRATEEETNYCLGCIETIKQKLNIENDSKCFFGKHAQEFADELKVMLRKRDIEYFYDTYEAYCVGQNIKKCKNVLDTYEPCNTEKFKTDFNKEFKNYIIDLAEKRYLKLPESFDDNYILYFKQLCDITIDSNYKRVKYIPIDNKKDYKDILNDNVNIHVNGNQIIL